MSAPVPQGRNPGRPRKRCPWTRGERIYLAFASLFLAAALVWAGLAVYAALDHNPQGEFCDYSRFDGQSLSAWLGFDCDLQWRNLGALLLIAASIGSIPLILYLAVLAGRMVWRLLRAPASDEP